MKDSPIARAVRRWENKHYIMDANDIELLIKALHNTIKREARYYLVPADKRAHDLVNGLTGKLTKGDR